MRRLALALAVALLPTLGPALPAASQTLRVGVINQDAGSLDPHRATASQDKGTAAWMHDGLVRFPEFPPVAVCLLEVVAGELV